MTLEQNDYNINKTKMAEIKQAVSGFYEEIDIKESLALITENLLALLDKCDLVLTQQHAQELTGLVTILVPEENQEKIIDELLNWIREKSAPRDISAAVAKGEQHIISEQRNGSIEDMTIVLKDILKNPNETKEAVEILRPLYMGNSLLLSDDFLTKLIQDHIQPVMANTTTKKLLIPVLGDNSIWRIIIINFDMKKNPKVIADATLWDALNPRHPQRSRIFKILTAAVKNLSPQTDKITALAKYKTYAPSSTFDFVINKLLRELPSECVKSDRLLKRLRQHFPYFSHLRPAVVSIIAKDAGIFAKRQQQPPQPPQLPQPRQPQQLPQSPQPQQLPQPPAAALLERIDFRRT